jgi:hypothetical protein
VLNRLKRARLMVINTRYFRCFPPGQGDRLRSDESLDGSLFVDDATPKTNSMGKFVELTLTNV